MLTRLEAEEMLLQRVQREGRRNFSVARDRTVERPFGWLFFLLVTDGSDTAARKCPGFAIVNKYVGQVVATLINYAPERFIEIYEGLL
jgi:hypothetical protein